MKEKNPTLGTLPPIELPAIEPIQAPSLSAPSSADLIRIPTIESPPPIENDSDFNAALKQYGQLTEDSPFKAPFEDIITEYQTKELLQNYRDPITDKEKQTYQEKHNRLQALTKDWKQSPEAREVIAKSYGEAFAKSWEYATPEEKALTGGIKILDELYSKEGDEENSSMWRYIEHNKLKDNTHITSAKDIWQHYSDNIKPLIEAQNKEAQAEQSFAEKSQPFFNARLEGKTVLESLKTIPNLSPEEKLYAITQCGDGSEWNKSVLNAKEWVEQNGIKFAEQVSPMQTQDFAYKLLDLKKKNQKAYDKVIAIYKNEITKERNDGIAVISPFINSLSASVNSLNDFFRGRTSIGGAILFLPDERSPEQSQQISEVRNMLKELQESPEGASYWRSIFDGVAQIGATTAMLPIGGVQSIFIVGGGDSYDKNYGESGDKLSSILRGVVAGGTEALTERLGGEFLFKNMKFLAKKLPFMEKATGYFGGTVDMLRAANYKSAAARFSSVTVASGASEWAEELIQPTLQASLDASIAWLFNEKNGMTYKDWKDQISAAMSTELMLQMTLFGAVAGGAQIPMFAREAKISRMNAPEVQTLTRCDEATAKNIANIINPTEKAQAIREASIDNILSQEEQSQNLFTGINNMQEDFTVLNAMTAYQAEVELGNIPKYEEQEDGSYLATDRTINEDGSSTENTRSLSPELAMAEINAHLEDKLAQRITTIQSNLTARATIDTMKNNNAFVFEKMSDTETKQTLNTLAAAAGLKIKEGAPTHSIDPALSQNLTLGELQQLPNAAAKREQIATTQGSSAPFASNAYRVRLSSGKTLIRYVEGKITMNQLLEEVVETHLYNYFAQTGKNISWAAGNIRAIQKQLKEQGTIKENLIKEDGEIEMMDILESMGILAQASFIHRIDSLKLPEFLKDFIKWCRSIISQASHLADLGKAIHSLDKAGKLDKTFAQAIYEAADITQEFWKDAAIDSTHLELARIASAAVAPYQTNLSSSQDISNGAYKAWLNTTTIEDTDQDNATPPYKKTEENSQTPTLDASFSVTAHDKQGNTLHPETFITKKDGNIDWLHLKKGKEWKPIRLRVGEDTAPHKGYGLTHIVASRSLDDQSFWDNMSPESYIEDICANASELYETGNRELIVKGKRPSQWMFIQLMDNGSFYSIVTAHPIKQNKKPLGKRVPLRSAPASSVNVDQNSFPDSNANDATPQSATAAWNSESNLPNGLPIVNIKDVTCTFDDGSTLQASFSIAPQEEQQWKSSLNNYLTKGVTDRAMPIKMSSAPNVLQALGFSDRDIVITPSTLDKVMGGKHNLDRSHIERLAAAIHDPIMIVDSATQAGAIVVLTEVKTAEGNVIAAIHLDKQERGGFYHVVASAYNKKSPWMFVEQIKANKLRYIEKKRALAWARENRLQLPALSSQKGKAIVLTPEDVVKYKNAQNKKSFPLSDFLQGDQTDSTSFSVIGTHAKNWETIKHNAFTGRDDGMLRVELDASQSSITPDLAQRIQRRLAKDNSEKKVRFTLKNVLDYTALYQAYPKLANMSITLASLGARGTRAWYSPKTKKITINTLNFNSNTYDSAALRSTILHEIQHAIQHIEGYTYGSNSRDEAEYLRAGGEIEARNVQQRRDLTAQQRQEQPFNNSLEYKGEALPSISPAPIEIPFNLVSGEFDKDWTSLRRSSNKAHSNFIALITQALNKDAERLTRYSELSEDERADMSITLMRATNIAKTAVMYMPKGYRIGLKPYLDWLEVFTDVAHNGTLDWAASAPAPYWSQLMIGHLKKTANMYIMEGYNQEQTLELMKDYGETRLYMLLNKLILRVSKNLDEYGKTKLHDQITELLHSTKPTLNKNGQYSTGKLSVESRRELARLTQLMQLEPENLDNKLNEKRNPKKILTSVQKYCTL